MPTMNVRPLKPTSNAKMLNTIRNQASTDYRNRIPLATQANIRDTLEHLHNNRPLMNEFMDVLVNRIGSVVVRNMSWTNPLAQFKRGMLNYGDTIEEIQTGLLTAHTYDPDREYLERDIFGTELAPAEANFHKVNRQNYYKVTVNEALLKRAFLEDGGLSTFIDGLMNAPVTSDNWDEFLATCQLIPEFESMGGFHHVRVGDIRDWTSEGPEVRVALRKMRALADTLPFISTKYNAAHMPVFADKSELILLASPEYQAAIDVEALAGAFNVSKADVYGRIVTIPQVNFGVDEIQAVLTTNNFFVIADQLLENRTADNPVSLNRNYFMHHWQVISASRFAPAIAFTKTLDDEVINVQNVDVTSVETPTIADGTDGITYVDSGVTEATRGGMVQLDASAVTTPDDADYSAVMWSVSGQSSYSTFITSTGVLHVAGDETATTLHVIATSVALDAGDVWKAPKTATLDVPVTGAFLPVWPEKGQPGTTPATDTNASDTLAVVTDTEGNPLVTIHPTVTTYSVATSTGTVQGSNLVLEVPDGTTGTVDVASGGKSFTVTLNGGDGEVTYTVSVTQA